MGEPSFTDRIREMLAHWGWKLFIRFQYSGREEKYFAEKDCEVLCQKKIKHCLVCGDLDHENCDNFPV